jgi:Na+/phosphate symporter
MVVEFDSLFPTRQPSCDMCKDIHHLTGRDERLEAGICSPEANVIFTEILRNLERISDHADNLGVSVMRA